EQRDRVMRLFRAGSVDLLIATDVAARGLDIGHLSHVVNFHVPCAAEPYVHRIGRVGRAGREGVAITLAEPREHRLLKAIERVTKQRISVEQVPTVADLRARRLELTRAALHESLLTDDLERFRVVIETLADEFVIVDVALAGVRVAPEASAGEADEQETPQVAGAPVPARPQRQAADRRAGRRGRAADGEVTRLFLGLGRSAGIRPQDLVGAIANESR